MGKDEKKKRERCATACWPYPPFESGVKCTAVAVAALLLHGTGSPLRNTTNEHDLISTACLRADPGSSPAHVAAGAVPDARTSVFPPQVVQNADTEHLRTQGGIGRAEFPIVNNLHSFWNFTLLGHFTTFFPQGDSQAGPPCETARSSYEDGSNSRKPGVGVGGVTPLGPGGRRAS